MSPEYGAYANLNSLIHCLNNIDEAIKDGVDAEKHLSRIRLFVH